MGAGTRHAAERGQGCHHWLGTGLKVAQLCSFSITCVGECTSVEY